MEGLNQKIDSSEASETNFRSKINIKKTKIALFRQTIVPTWTYGFESILKKHKRKLQEM